VIGLEFKGTWFGVLTKHFLRRSVGTLAWDSIVHLCSCSWHQPGVFVCMLPIGALNYTSLVIFEWSSLRLVEPKLLWQYSLKERNKVKETVVFLSYNGCRTRVCFNFVSHTSALQRAGCRVRAMSWNLRTQQRVCINLKWNRFISQHKEAERFRTGFL